LKAEVVSAEVVSCEELAPGVFYIIFKAPYLACCAPGNFLMIRPGDGLDPLLRRPFAVFTVDQDRVGILVQRKGRGTELLARCRRGEFLNILGPLGNSFELTAEKIPVCLVAGGMGIAPLFFLAMTLKREGHPFRLYYGAVSQKTLVPVTSFGLSAEDVCYATDDGSIGVHGTVSDAVQQRLNTDMPNGRMFASICCCGPVPMVRSVCQLATAVGLPCQVSLEERMACGVGACLGCVVFCGSAGYKRVCADGPVFDAADIKW